VQSCKPSSKLKLAIMMRLAAPHCESPSGAVGPWAHTRSLLKSGFKVPSCGLLISSSPCSRRVHGRTPVRAALRSPRLPAATSLGGRASAGAPGLGARALGPGGWAMQRRPKCRALCAALALRLNAS
jgi:hypothetical protein